MAPPPKLPHEEFPARWPQPDYFAVALTMTREKAAENAGTIRHRYVSPQNAPRYVVMPVQTQAFGFAPAFVALVGASFDDVLRRMPVAATQQTDFLDGRGPFVRRIGDEASREFAEAYAGKEIVSLFIGHDGASSAFVDLVVGTGTTSRHAHRTLALPDEPLQALDAISKALPGMIGEAGFAPAGAPAKLSSPGTFACKVDTWNFADDAAQDDIDVACRAFAIGTLLPDFDVDVVEMGPTDSPAKLAWLARAYVAASPQAASSPDATRIRDLSLRQLGYLKRRSETAIGTESTDPVVRPLSTLMSLDSRTSQSPVRSGRELRETLAERESTGLPPFAQALFMARARYEDAFVGMDFCAIDSTFPGFLMRRQCPGFDGVPPTRPASQAQSLLYEEWRVASSFKDLAYNGIAQGRGDQTRRAIAALPTDVAAHPFISRLRMKLFSTLRPPLGESFDDQVARSRSESLAFVQSTVDLQRNDFWIAAYSLSRHSPHVQNASHNDRELIDAITAEDRLLAVMDFDRFQTRTSRPARRRPPGELAWFMSEAAPFDRPIPSLPMGTFLPAASGPFPPAFAASFPRPPVASMTASAPTVTYFPYVKHLFTQPPVNSFGRTRSEMESVLATHPDSMELRARIAIARLKEGDNVGDVAKFFHEQPGDERIDHAISESHLWAAPAHVFFLSGETAAALPFYQKVRQIGTGSGSDLLARVRIALIEGDVASATEGSRARLRRYDGDFARRDLAGLQFVTGQSDAAWSTFLESASTSSVIELWDAALTGHRMAGLDLVSVQRWLTERMLGKARSSDVDMTTLYLHRFAVTDRVPSLSDIELLLVPSGTVDVHDHRWSMSAVLARGAMADEEPDTVMDRFAALNTSSPHSAEMFMLPLYAWTAARGKRGDQSVLDMVLRVDIGSDFDHLLAKAMLLSVRGMPQESARFLRAAHYELGQQTWGANGLDARPVDPTYEYARAVFLLYRQTKDPALKQEALTFARATAQAWPYFGWTYGLLAAVETDPKRRTLATCRARFLDPNSYFLQEAERVRGERERVARCPAKLW